MPLRPPNPALAFKGPYGAFLRTPYGGGAVQTQVYPPYTPTGGLVLGGTATVATVVAGGNARVAPDFGRRGAGY